MASQRRDASSKKSVSTAVVLSVVAGAALVVIVFIVLPALLWTAPPRGWAGPRKRGGARAVVATVNGDPITAGEFEKKYQAQLGDGQPVTIDNATSLREQIFQSMARALLFDRARRELRFKDGSREHKRLAEEFVDTVLADFRKQAELNAKEAAKAAKTPEARKELESVDTIYRARLADFIKTQGGPDLDNPTDEELAHWTIYEFLLNKKKSSYEQFDDYCHMRLLGAELIRQFPTDPRLEGFVKKLETQEVKGRWIFIKAEEKTAAGLEAAKERAGKLREAVIKDTSSFSALARASSSDPNSSSRGGELGWHIGGEQMLPVAAEYLMFSQHPGEVGPIMLATVYGWSGMDVGYAFLQVQDMRERADRKKDYDWRTEKYLAMLQARRRYEVEAGRAYMEEQQYRADLVGKVTEFEFYVANWRGEVKKADELRVKAADDASLPPEVQAAFAYQAQKIMRDPERRIRWLEIALPYAGARTTRMYLDLAQAYLNVGKKEQAIEQLQFAADSGEDSDRNLREEVRQQFKKLGYAEGVKQMDAWLAAHPVNR